MNIGDIYFSFRGDSKQLEADAKKSGATAGDNAGKSFGDKFKSALGGDFSGFVKGGFGLGAGLAVFSAVTGALGGVADAIGTAQQAASDLSEQQAKLDQVFDDSASTITEWSEDSAMAMGLSQRAAIEATGTLGNFLQAMGTAEDTSADMSMGIVELSSDIASFNNVAGGTEEVLDAMQSGLSGETEPLRRFGIDISDAAVQTELLNLGVRKTGGAFTQAQKIQGRYSLIMKQTTKAQGDFNRTSDGTANQQRILDALQENLNAKIGVFADEVLRAAQGLAIDLVQGIEDAGEAFHNLQRFLDPAMAELEDIDKELIRLAESRGLSTEAVLAYVEAQREEVKAAREAAADPVNRQREEDLAKLRVSLSLTTDLTEEQIEAEARRIIAERDGTAAVQDKTAATDELTKVQRLANEAIDGFLDLSDAEVAALTETEAAIQGTGKVVDAGAKHFEVWAGWVNDGAKAAAAFGRKAESAAEETNQLADQVDLAKGSFKSFWKALKEEQKNIRWLIRNPDKLAAEISKTERMIAKAEKQKNRLLRDGFQEGDALALEAIDRRIRQLTGKRDEYRALGVKWGNAAEAGVEAGFDPNLVAAARNSLNQVRTTLQNIFANNQPPKRHSGGDVKRGLAYVVGTPGHEELFVPQMSGRIIDNPDTEAIMRSSGGDSGSGGMTFHAEVHGLPMQAHTPREVIQQARRAAQFGVLGPRAAQGFETP